MANFASTCFVGSALRWHISLDKTTRSDWALLEQALIEAYPPVPRIIEQMPLPSLPARFATSPTNPSITGEQLDTLSESIEIARVRVVTEDGASLLGVLSRTLNSHGCHVLSESSSDALHVEYMSSMPHHLRLLNSPTDADWLSACFLGKLHEKPGKTQRAFLVAAKGTDDQGTTSHTSKAASKQPRHSALWHVSSSGALTASVRTTTGSSYPLVAVMQKSERYIYFTSNEAIYYLNQICRVHLELISVEAPTPASL